MKRVIIILIVLILGQLLLSVSVQMNDGLIYEGIFKAKLEGYIYLLDGSKLYELPIKEIVKIVDNGTNITSVIVNSEDYSYISIEDNEFSIYTHGTTENQENDNINNKETLLKMRYQKIDDNNSNEVLLLMSDREFAIYELEQKQKQAELVSKKIDRVSDTMWTIWLINIGVSVIATIIVLNQ